MSLIFKLLFGTKLVTIINNIFQYFQNTLTIKTEGTYHSPLKSSKEFII